jgi:hypothetical protein
MKVVIAIPKAGNKRPLRTLLIETERAKRLRSTFVRQRAGRWTHLKYRGWINWEEAKGGILVAEIQSKVHKTEWQLLQAFVGYLERHLGEYIDSITITYR